jgi:deoxyribose-phosphate aldolase
MEVAGHRVFTALYANIYALVEEMAVIENSTPNQQRLKVILESTPLQMQAAKATSQANPSKGLDMRAPAHSRLGPLGNQGGGQ